jgi:hypothetical protein
MSSDVYMFRYQLPSWVVPSQAPTVVPGLLTAGHLAAMHTAVDQLASVLKDPLYLALEQELPPQAAAVQTILSRSDRCAWRKLLATLTAIEKNVKS